MSRKRKSETEAQFARFFQPVIDALRSLGGSGRPPEVKDWILLHVELPEDFLNKVNKGGETKFSNQVDWARFYLARSGFLGASQRGVWSLTPKGRRDDIDSTVGAEVIRAVDQQMKTAREVSERTGEPSDEEDVDSYTSGSSNYKARVLEVVLALPPDGFERLCQRLLRESGFEKVKVTGRTGDGGIDGQGILQLNPFVSFRVLFQCKKYQGAVGPDKIRDFRGAMAGRADKGIIITTGAFTPAAAAESSRDGAEPIELVDGEELVRLLEDLELGLRPRRTFEVDEEFFEQFKS